MGFAAEFYRMERFWVAVSAMAAAVVAISALVIAVFQDSLKLWWSAPELKVYFLQNPPDCHWTQDQNGTGIYYFRFRVRNEGLSAAKLTECVIENLYRLDQATNSFVLVEDFSHLNLMQSSPNDLACKARPCLTC